MKIHALCSWSISGEWRGRHRLGIVLGTMNWTCINSLFMNPHLRDISIMNSFSFFSFHFIGLSRSGGKMLMLNKYMWKSAHIKHDFCYRLFPIVCAGSSLCIFFFGFL
jgi:hypothetical protein